MYLSIIKSILQLTDRIILNKFQMYIQIRQKVNYQKFFTHAQML